MLTNSPPRTRRANGTSSTHRRLSLSTTLTHPPTPSHQTPLTPSSSNVYHPPHHYNRGGAGSFTSTSYGKEELLSIFKVQDQSGGLNRKIDELILGDIGSGGGWSREDAAGNTVAGAEVCWEKDGGLKPVSLEEMTEEERDLFASSVNSPHKVPQNQNTQNQQIHHNSNNHTPPQVRSVKLTGGGSGTSTTPAATRPQNRRRETADVPSSSFAATPPQITRRRTELRDDEKEGGGRDRSALFGRWGSISAAAGGGGDEDGKEKEEGSTGGTIGRNTGLFRRGSAAWGGSNVGTSGILPSTSALNSPMGTFGNGTFGGAMGGFSLQSATTPGIEKKNTIGAGKANIQPTLEETKEAEEEAARFSEASVGNHGEEERPMTSDTDPFGVGDDRDDGHSPLPTPSIADQQRMKSPFAIGTGTATTPRAAGTISTPTKVRSEMGFTGGLGGMGSMGMVGLHTQLQNLQISQQIGGALDGRSREGSIGGIMGGVSENEPLSPTETNPYQSPAPEKVDDDDMIHELTNDSGIGGVIGGGLKRDAGAPGSDRSGRSSTAGLGSGLAGFGGLSGSGLWGGQVGTPGGGLGGNSGSFFGGGLGDLSSPGGSLLGGGGGLGGMGGGSAFGSASRASRLGALFPPDQQMEEDHNVFGENDAFGDLRFGGAFGGSRRGFGSSTESPLRERGDVSDLFGLGTSRGLGPLGGISSEGSLFNRDREEPMGLHSLHQGPQQTQGIQPPGSSAPIRPSPGTVPPPQQHVMVMPDKIQWTYRDPSGTIQGPFSGLEMHDWYKAGFFTQDLAVKRVEDVDFEPLGNLVRRIGNTREPFLVPMQGLAPPGVGAAWGNTPGWINEPQQPTQPGTVQPPFAGSFPTFGTTLTADQQNALERRKQEEQYLMARQREFLAQQQHFAKQQAAAQQVLHHQHSAQSLHSQPSFGSLQGSLQSPGGFGATTGTTGVGVGVVGGQNAFEPGVLLRQAGAAAGGVDVFAGHLGLQGDGFVQQQQVQQQALLQQQQLLERQRQQMARSFQTQQQQDKQQQLHQAQQQAAAVIAQAQRGFFDDQTGDEEERKTEDIGGGEGENVQQQLQQQQDWMNAAQNAQQEHERRAPTPAPVQPPQAQTPQRQQNQHVEEQQPQQPQPQVQPKITIPKAPSVKASPAVKHSQPVQQSVWQHIEIQSAPLVQPFPPPPGAVSHAAPEPLSLTGSAMARSPSIDTPPSASIAPWANKENELGPKGPSLKEIQELEAKQNAIREAAEEEQRRALALQQAANQPPPPAPGLPATAIWATSPSSTPSGSSASAWVKPLVKANNLPTGGTKKTLQQIQKEEEQRKLKAQTAAAAQAALNNPHHAAAQAAGKRYADLASKAAAGPGNGVGVMTGGAWTTVGPGGKSKGSTPVPTVAQTVRAPASPAVGAATPAVGVKKVLVPTPPVKAQVNPQEEFVKWIKASLKGLKAGYQPDNVVQHLLNLPSEPDIIADIIYGCSDTMDIRWFANEFIRRRTAAQKGVVIEAGTNGPASGSAGGWNEVAKSRVLGKEAPGVAVGGVGMEAGQAFKVVAKKKGRRA
ncbi:kinesin-like protein [Rhizina undulata]